MTGGYNSYWNIALSAWLDTFIYSVMYGSSGLVDQITGSQNLSGTIVVVFQDNYTYDAAFNINWHTHSIWDGSVWLPDYHREFAYDNTANIREQMDWDYKQGSFYITNDFDFTYPCPDNLDSTRYTSYNSALGIPNDSDEILYFYNSSAQLVRKVYYNWNSSTSTYVPATVSNYSNFTSGGMPQTERDSTYNTGTGFWTATVDFNYTYNSHNQMTTRQGFLPGTTTPASGMPLSHYYYQNYIVSEVQQVSNAVDVQVFPNPSRNYLNLTVKWKEAQPFTLGLYDITGRLIMSKSIAATLEYTTQIPVNKLPAGNYIVKISGANGPITKEVVIGY